MLLVKLSLKPKFSHGAHPANVNEYFRLMGTNVSVDDF